MSALILTSCIIWCVCSIKSNRHKDGFHRLRQHHDDYEDEIRMMSAGSKKSLLSHEFQDETDTEEETVYSSKHWPIRQQGVSLQRQILQHWATLKQDPEHMTSQNLCSWSTPVPIMHKEALLYCQLFFPIRIWTGNPFTTGSGSLVACSPLQWEELPNHQGCI